MYSRKAVADVSNRRLHTLSHQTKETFVGGPWDGRRVPIEKGRQDVWAQVELPTAASIIVGESLLEQVEFKKVLYKRVLFAGERGAHSLFVEHSLTPDDVLTRLIARYGGDP